MTIRSIFIACMLWACLPLSQAYAHAVLMGTDPKADVALDAGPSRITLTFNESVGPIFLRVLDSSGNEVGGVGPVGSENFDIFVDLSEPLDDGVYLVTYRVVSADTHPVGGSYVFTVGAAVATDDMQMSAPVEVQDSNFWTLPVAVNRTLQFASLLLATGLALFGLLIKTPAKIESSLRRSGSVVAFVAAGTFIAAVGLGGAEMMGGSVRVFDGQSWSMGINTTLGPSLAIGLVGLIILLAGFMVGFEGRGRPLMWTGIIVSTSSLLVTGHAATADPRWFMTPIVGIHLLCVAFWFGALWPLLISLTRLERSDTVRIFRDFTFWAVASVALILLSGIGITLIQVDSISALFGTDYGFKLLIKIGLVIALLGLAGLNKIIFTPALEKGRDWAPFRLTRSINGEVALIIGVFALTTTLSQATPPRALAQQAAGGEMTETVAVADAIDTLVEDAATRTGAPTLAAATSGFETTIERQGYALQIMINPAKPGQNAVMAHIMDSDGKMFEALSVTTQWALPAAGLEPLKIELEQTMPGMYEADLNQIVISGNWELRVDALIDDFTKVIYRTEVPIQ